MSTTRSTKKNVNHYGVHWTDSGIAYLLQQDRKGENALGLDDPCPFVVIKHAMHSRCGHAISIRPVTIEPAAQVILQNLMDDPLVQAMAPLPKPVGEPCLFLHEPNPNLARYLNVLAQMTSPVIPPVQPSWTIDAKKALAQLQMTNIQPWVLTGLQGQGGARIFNLAETAMVSPRQLIMTSNATLALPSSIKRITTNVLDVDLEEFQSLPWKDWGSRLLREHMRTS